MLFRSNLLSVFHEVALLVGVLGAGKVALKGEGGAVRVHGECDGVGSADGWV